VHKKCVTGPDDEKVALSEAASVKVSSLGQTVIPAVDQQSSRGGCWQCDPPEIDWTLACGHRYSRNSSQSCEDGESCL
jgi:hypothetical protein